MRNFQLTESDLRRTDIWLWMKDKAAANIFIVNHMEETLFHGYVFVKQPIAISMTKRKLGLYISLSLRKDIDDISTECNKDNDYNQMGN